MEPTQVRVGVMDARRPEIVVTLPARHLTLSQRLVRGGGRLFGISGVLLVLGNILLLTFPIPHVHLCLFPLAMILGPVIGFIAWRDRVLLAESTLPCPRCHDEAKIPDGLSGWPARFNCERCGIMVELNQA